MLYRNASGISRALGCVWLVVAASSGLLAIWNLPLLIWWPLGLFGMGLLAMSSAHVSARLILLLSAVAVGFALWVAAGSTAGNENFAMLIAAASAASGIGSAAARSLMNRGALPAHVTFTDAD